MSDNSTGGSSKSGPPKQQSAGPYLAVIIVLAIGLGVCLYFLSKNKSGDSPPPPAAAGSQDPSPGKEENAAPVVDVDKVNRSAEGSQEAAADGEAKAGDNGSREIAPDSLLGRISMTLKNYFAASSAEEKLKYVIDPQRVEPLMRDFYFRSPLQPMELKSLSSPTSLPFKGVSFWKVDVFFTNGANGFAAMRIIDGVPKIDWESEVRYSSMDWEKWADSKEDTTGVFRVYAILDQYYPEPFTDRTRYVCIKLRTMESTRTVFAYLDAKEPDQEDLIRALAGGQMQECTLEMKRVKSSSAASPIAAVTKVLSTSWIVVPDDEES